MRILVVSPKILDESLSSTTQDASFEQLHRHAEIHLIGRFRNSNTAVGRPYMVTPVNAPPVPVVNMLWFIIRGTVAVRRAILDSPPDVILIEPASVLPSVLGRWLSIGGRHTPIHLDLRTLPVPSRSWRAPAEKVFTWLMMRIAKTRCGGYSAITPGVARWMGRIVDVDAARIPIWATGVDPDLFDPDSFPPREPDRAELRFLYHGAIYLSRGLGDLIRAVDLLRGRVDHKLRLTILGEGPDFDVLSRLSDQLGLTGIITMTRAIPLSEVPRVIAEHDIGVIPLPDIPVWSTSSPTKLMEYLAMAKPVVVTDIEAHRIVLGDDGPALWAGASSPSALADAMESAYSSIESVTHRAIEERAAFVRAYSWDAQASVLLSALRSTAGRDHC